MVKCKICGLFREEDVEFANIAKPDYVGFVYACGRRGVSRNFAKAARERLDPSIISVGVFVCASIEEIFLLCSEGIIQMAQLHGGESEDYIRELKKACSVPVIKAVSADGGLPDGIWETSADYLLLDSGKGGTGKAFDWSIIQHAADKPFFLAGGISPDNASNAASTGAYCLDASSALETGGFKDLKKMIAFAKACSQS
jgi:phosphoribosylanthranilate isomerase